MVQSDPWIAAGVREGEILAGRYRVERILGVGGMGIVVAARHLQLETRVALKFLLPAMLANHEAVGRFAREARAAVRINSEHVARVLDVGVLENGAPYMVMEFLDGGDLADWLRQRGPLPIDLAVDFVLQACVAVADAHGLGIVHRDLKPSNLFCVRRSDGQFIIKLLDFGISKLVDPNAPDPAIWVTKTSAVMGSVLYMSPEQLQSSKDADAQSDIWAIGVILYELLSGRVPFEGGAPTEVAIKVATQPPPSLRDLRSEVPAGLESVVFTCLEKDRQRRYRNVAEVAKALAHFAPKRARALVERIVRTIQGAGLSVSALEMPSSPRASETVLAPETMVPVGHTSTNIPTTRSRTGLVLPLALTGVLAIAGAAFGIMRATRNDSSSVSPLGSETGPAVEAGLQPPMPNTTPLSIPASGSADAASVRIEADARSALPPSTSQTSRRPPGPQPSQTPKTIASSIPSNCDPPFTFDDEGRKHYKHECYEQKPP